MFSFVKVYFFCFGTHRFYQLHKLGITMMLGSSFRFIYLFIYLFCSKETWKKNEPQIKTIIYLFIILLYLFILLFVYRILFNV